MAAKSGQYAALFINSGTSTAASGEAMTQVGSTTEFYIAARTSPNDKSWWDPLHAPVFHCGGNVIVASEVDYAAGFATFPTWTTGAVTADVYWFTPEALGGVYGFDLEAKADTKEVTCFPATLNNPTQWRSYIKTLMDWTGTASRHFFYGRAWKLVDCTLAHSDLYWILREWGSPGNLRRIEYIVSGNDTPLEVVYDVGTKKFTITVQTGPAGAALSTAAQIKAHVEADAALNALVELQYPPAETGTGIVEAKTAAYFSGGRDQGTDFDLIGDKILFRGYLDITTGSLEMISGVCHLIGVPINVKLDAIQEADLKLQGQGRLKYHTV
jgi:hypothetical protein